MQVTWNTDRTISIDPPKRPKKLTGTRLASVMGLNRWNTPFQTWCEVTGAYRMPFEDTVYTLAGKAIEPLQLEYMRKAYGMDDLVLPTDVYGPDPFKTTYGNFFHDPVFGGMWDALLGDPKHPDAVIECKTTKRSEDWMRDGELDPPEYYALQAALYAWLLKCDDVVMVVSFLKEGDYENPGDFVPSASNTATFEFSLSERYPDFEVSVIDRALAWWRRHVLTGDSPTYDEAADADYLTPLRTATLNPTTDIEALMVELRDLSRKVEELAPVEKRIKAIKDQLKEYCAEKIPPDAMVFTLEADGVSCKLRRREVTSIDKERLEADGLLDEYSVTEASTAFTVKFD